MEHSWPVAIELHSFVVQIASVDLARLDELYKVTQNDHTSGVIKVDLVEATIRTKGFPIITDDTEATERDRYFSNLVPGHTDLHEELTGFARDLDLMNREELFGMLQLALREHKLSKAKLELVEKRIHTLRPVLHVGEMALNEQTSGPEPKERRAKFSLRFTRS